ncbi:hypothetical protein L484_001118 [Morus notabilis]|uniref:Uncharacterized protein n=1 Tax=Morus notabilis TaxID=981085 RepID=W9QQN0_9ROSA|nr:hypothetical protein L484_001118 [Morus notabilis]
MGLERWKPPNFDGDGNKSTNFDGDGNALTMMAVFLDRICTVMHICSERKRERGVVLQKKGRREGLREREWATVEKESKK